MENLKCPKCGNTIDFYREIHMTGKIRVNKHGKLLKRIYDTQNGELYAPICCCKCNSIVADDGDIY